MKKIFRIFILLSLTLLVLITPINAFSINMNLEDTQAPDTTNIVDQSQLGDDSLEISTNNNTTETNDSSSRVTVTKNTDEDEFLTVENVLSIIIIVIGLLLIFLAIAILIRLK